MENTKYCQSCGMPMAESDQFGTNKDGSKNEDYCVYCFKDGEFTADMTMDEMIEFCAQHVNDWGQDITKEEAIVQMKEYFPKLKRWANA